MPTEQEFLLQVLKIIRTEQSKDPKIKLYEVNAPNIPKKLFLVPNEPVLQKLKAMENRLGINLVSLTDVPKDPQSSQYKWLPFDQDQPYLELWERNKWLRIAHLWLTLGQNIFNNSLIRIQTFPYPENLRPSTWQTPTKLDDYGWMKIMIEPTFFLETREQNLLQKIMKIFVVSSYRHLVHEVLGNDKLIQEINVLQQGIDQLDSDQTVLKESKTSLLEQLVTALYHNYKQALDELLDFTQPQHRLAAFMHFVKSGDRVLEPRFTQEVSTSHF